MKVILKHQFYFELEVQDGSDRNLIAQSFEKELRPQFDQLLSKIKFDDSDRASLYKLTGLDVKIRILSNDQFKKTVLKDSLRSV